jgi:glycosyltransferase involved in cell wall biosynthesis
MLNNTSALRLGGTLSPEEISRALLAADVLIHVESFDPDVQQYTRFSLSTKVPQYMAMGRPILGYGPGNIASIEYINHNNIGIVQDRPNKQELVKAIRQLASSEEQRRFWGRRGWEIAKEKHFNNRVREHFREVLYECFIQANTRN